METTSDAAETMVSAEMQDRIGFARHVFDNCQALIRSVDTKAGALLGLGLFFAASVFPISKDAVPHISLRTPILELASVTFLLSGSGFFLLFLGLINALGRVIRPRGARFYKRASETRNLMWQEHVVKYDDNGSYFAAVAAAAPSDILRNLTDQAYELANISKDKMTAINTGFILLSCLAVSWIINVISGLVLIGWTK